MLEPSAADLSQLTLGVLGLVVGVVAMVVGSTAVANRLLERTARPGLRALVILSVLFGLNGVVVRCLGMAGWLAPAPMLAVACGLGFALWRGLDPALTISDGFRPLVRALWLAVSGPPGGIGRIAFAAVLFLCLRGGLVEGMDSLSIHGPLIAEWLRSHEVPLLSHWSYPHTWESQYVPLLMALGGDQLVVVPRLLSALMLCGAVRELAGMCRVPGRIAWSAGWFVALSPLLWGLTRGEGTLKNDTPFAVGLLVMVIASTRVLHRPQRSWLMLLPAMVLVVGTKPTGFLYLGLAGVVLTIARLRGPLPADAAADALHRRRIGAAVAVCLASLAAAIAPQWANLLVRANPVFPISVTLGNLEVFPGEVDVAGTSILSHWTDRRTWVLLLRGAVTRAGGGVVATVAMAVAAVLVAIVASGSRRLGRPVAPMDELGRPLPLVPWFVGLTALYLATPWSRGHRPDDLSFLTSGLSLRYALAPLAIGCVIVVAALPWMRITRGPRALAAALIVGSAAAPWSAVAQSWFAAERRDSWLWLAVSVSSAAVGLRYRRGRRERIFRRLVSWCVPIVALLVFVGCLESRRRREWGGDFHGLWEEFARRAGGEPEVIATTVERPVCRYLLLGRHLGNHLVTVDPTAGERVPDTVRLTLAQQRGGGPEVLARQLEALELAGWREVASAAEGRSRLLVRSPDGPP